MEMAVKRPPKYMLPIRWPRMWFAGGFPRRTDSNSTYQTGWKSALVGGLAHPQANARYNRIQIHTESHLESCWWPLTPQWLRMYPLTPNDSHNPLQWAIAKGCGYKFGVGFSQIQASPVRSNRLSNQEKPGLNAVVLHLPLRREERAQSTVRPKRVLFGSFSFTSSAIRIDDGTHRYGSIAVVGGQFLERLCNFVVNPRTDLACPY